tara:strand:- start:61865 stop:62866 length:1002 start_codon:yes stop_codon:yes gene_type:complete
MQKVEILHSVGQGGKNKAIDVALIQALLKAYYLSVKVDDMQDKSDDEYDFSLLPVNGRSSDFLISAINRFQQDIVHMKVPDGRVDPKGGSFNKLMFVQDIEPVSLMKTLFPIDELDTSFLSGIPTEGFKKLFKQYHGLTISKGEDLAGFFNQLKHDSDIMCFEWAAYMLATAYHETTFSFMPKSEVGQGRGYRYAKVFDVTDIKGIRGPAGLHYENVYYGRGYVQITWDYNYRHLGEALGMADDLFIKPDLALEPEIAYKIMSVGMREGIFTSKKLSDYMTESCADYYHARRIINGTDQAKKIAEYAQTIECLLRLASIPLIDHVNHQVNECF